jgi:hypothetical protein
MNTKLETPLAFSISFDARRAAADRWRVTAEYLSGYDIIGRYADESDARKRLDFERNRQSSNRIRIIVSGGVVQDVQNIPPGVIVELWDYDCEESDDGVESDSIGDPVLKSEWHPDKIISRTPL